MGSSITEISEIERSPKLIYDSIDQLQPFGFWGAFKQEFRNGLGVVKSTSTLKAFICS
jgi:hypothetical protein